MTRRTEAKKRQLRRTVSYSPRAFLALKALSKKTGKPMSALADMLAVDAAEAAGVEVMDDEEARNVMMETWSRRSLEDAQRNHDAYCRAVEVAREAFG